MGTEKLTLKDCFKYPKAQLINDLKLKCENLTEFIKAVDGQDLNFLLQDEGFRLILRDISELTDEEKNYIIDNYVIYDDGNIFPCPLNYLLNTTYDVYSGENFTVELADYLRSKNVMVEKKDWFATGKAVKE